jgi:hypothetical protein
LLRIDPAETASLVNEPGVRRFRCFAGGMDGWLQVDALGTRVLPERR